MSPESAPKAVVTRFAPSPTGLMHIGGIRTALFAYIWAKKNAGTFILRIDDTDKAREQEGSIEHIQEALNWLGVKWNYGPDKPGPFGSCIQSDRLATYKEKASELIAKGLAYPDPYTEAEVESFRKKADLEKRPFLFREHRPTTFETWDGSKPLRFKVPEIKKYHWNDLVRGPLEAGPEALDDFVLIKTDGYPTYNFAHIVDDQAMGITHILRADEFISSTPRFLSLYEALGIKPPVFATLPPILGEDRKKKLSKRDGAKDVLAYRAEGYLPEAIVNYLLLIGWHPADDREVLSIEEITAEFSLERIQSAGAGFSEEKLDWFNRQHLIRLSLVDFEEKAQKFMPSGLSITDRGRDALFALIKEKVAVYKEIGPLFADGGELHFVQKIADYKPESLLWKKNPDKETAKKHLSECRVLLKKISDTDFNADKIKAALWPYAEANGKGDVLWPLRMALTGQDRSPDPFVSAAILGREESLKRIDAAISKLS